MNPVNNRKLANIFADTSHHKTAAEIIRIHSTNKLDVRNVALDGLQLQSCRKVMDIGCGFGFFTRGLKGRLNTDSNILGIDFCAKYKTSYLESCIIAGLQGRFAHQNEKQINTIPTDSIDLVICSYALYFFPELIPQISRVLKSTGIFVIITHSENHLSEFINFVKETFRILGIQLPSSLPCQGLFNKFNDSNGNRLLLPWFGRVGQKKYCNSLSFEISDFEDLEDYFRFKQPYYIPDCLDNKSMVFNKIISRLHERLQSGSPFRATKDDTVYICKEPLFSK